MLEPEHRASQTSLRKMISMFNPYGYIVVCLPMTVRVVIVLGLMAAAVSLDASTGPAGAQAHDGALLIELDARDPSAGSETWKNSGALGAFRRVGSPKVSDIGGVRAVVFDGRRDAYRGPKTVPALEGNSPRTIEVWAFNPSVD